MTVSQLAAYLADKDNASVVAVRTARHEFQYVYDAYTVETGGKKIVVLDVVGPLSGLLAVGVKD